jgi:hypothetical protein
MPAPEISDVLGASRYLLNTNKCALDLEVKQFSFWTQLETPRAIKSLNPTACSISATKRLTAGCEIAIRSAARDTEPPTTTAGTRISDQGSLAQPTVAAIFVSPVSCLESPIEPWDV